MRAQLRNPVLVIELATLWQAVAVAPASAGSFEVRACSETIAPPQPLDGADDAWTFTSDDQGLLESVHRCPPANGADIAGLAIEDHLNGGDVPRGWKAEWQFHAAPNTSLTRVRLWRFAGKQLNAWELYTRTAEDTKLPGSDCMVAVNDFTCELSPEADWVLTPSTISVRVGIRCTNPMNTCATGATLHEAWSAIHRAIVTIEDNTSPTATGAGGGLLAGGYLRGAVNATLDSASDNTGIRAVQIKLNGNPAPVAQKQRTCDFTRRVPCADLTSTESVDVDTTTIPDGQHTVAVGAIDPAGNFTPAAGRQITVDNTAPAAPTPTSPQQQTVTAPSATISWANPTGQVAPITVAHISFCGPAGCSTHTQPVSGNTGTATLALPGPGAYSVGVAVADAAGNFDPAQVAGWSIVYPAMTAAPGTTPTPPAPGPMSTTPAPAPLPLPRVTPALKVAAAAVGRDRRTITVRGTVAPGVSGRVTITARARIHGRTRTVTRRTSIRQRRYAARLRLPSSAWRSATVSVRFAGSATHRPAGVTRHTRQHAR